MINYLILKKRKEVLNYLLDGKSPADEESRIEKEKLLEFYKRTGNDGLSFLQRQYRHIERENNGKIKSKFIEFYYKFLSPSIYEKNKCFIKFLEGIKNINDKLIFVDGINDKKSVFSFYNKIINDKDICKETRVKIIHDFLKQKSDNFKDFYNKNKYNYESLTQNTGECGGEDENSKMLYKSYPWLDNILLEKIYIGSSKYNVKTYVDKSNDELMIPIEYEGIDYFIPNDNFFGLISNQKNQRNQVQDDLIFVDKDKNELISFKILLKVFDLKDNVDKRMLQNENMFKKENDYMILLKKNLSEYTVELYLNNKVEDEHFKMGFEYLQRVITSLNPSSDYKNINMNEDEKSKIKSLRDLIREIANITVYWMR